MDKKSALSRKWLTLVGIFFVFSVPPIYAQSYFNVGYQFESPDPLRGGVNTQLSLQPGIASWPSSPPVLVYASYVWTQLNGASVWPYKTLFANNHGYTQQYLSLAYNPAGVATSVAVVQLIQDSAGTPYYLTSEYYKHTTPEGGVANDLLGYYLQVGGPGLAVSLAKAPVRLALHRDVSPTGTVTVQIFVLESDASQHAYVEKFTLVDWQWQTPSLARSLSAAGTPVDIGVVQDGTYRVAVLGTGTSQGSGGALYLLDESLVGNGPDYTSYRSDGNLVTVKGFARDASDAVAVDSSHRLGLYGDVLSPSGGHLAYYVAKHGTVGTGFLEGNYPNPVVQVSPPPGELVARRIQPRLTSLSSFGVSAGAVGNGSFLYVTGSASPDGYNVNAKTARFSELNGKLVWDPSHVVQHLYQNPSGIALDNFGKIFVGSGGTNVMAFQSYDGELFPGASGQWSSSTAMTPTALLLRRYTDHASDVFLAGSILNPDSTHMYTGVTTQFNATP